MQYRQLGNSGVRLSTIGIGTNRFGSDRVPQRDADRIISLAADLGVNHLDTADSYQHGASEIALGNALKGRWDEFFVASKFHFPTGEGTNDQGNSRYHIMNAVEASLARLQSDHIDLYYVHRWDEHTPLAETLRALDDLLRAGKIRYVGVSDFAVSQLAEAHLLSETRFWTPVVALQAHYHMLAREAEETLLPHCSEHGVGFIPYFPLAGGFLTGKYHESQAAPAGSRGETSQYVQQYMTKENYRRLDALRSWCKERDRGLNELALAWLAANPTVCSVISGVTSEEHLRANANAASWELSTEEYAEVTAHLSTTTK